LDLLALVAPIFYSLINIFPRFLMRAEAEWISREKNDADWRHNCAARLFLPPIGFGICAEFAVRISALIGEPSKLVFCL